MQCEAQLDLQASPQPSCSHDRNDSSRMTRVTSPGQRRTPDSLTYSRILDEVTGSGITQAELGQAVGASVRTVQNWATGGSAPAGVRMQRLLDLHYLVGELRNAYTDEGVQIWLHSRNKNLGGNRPIDLLKSGDVDAVVSEAERVAGAM